MAVEILIDETTADLYNADSAGWLALTTAAKDVHIFNASVYIQSNWTCVDIDWDDNTTWTDDLKRACAWYADADRAGVLFPDALSTETKRGRLVQETKKMGPMSKTLR